MSYINYLVGLLYWCGVNRLTCMCLIHVITEGCRATRRGKILLYMFFFLKKKKVEPSAALTKSLNTWSLGQSPRLCGALTPPHPNLTNTPKLQYIFYIWFGRMSIASSAQLPTSFICHRTVVSRIQEELTASCGIWAHDLPLTKRVLCQLS